MLATFTNYTFSDMRALVLKNKLRFTEDSHIPIN